MGDPRRLFLAAVVVLAAVFVVPGGASAGNFDEERMGCLSENPGICPAGTEGQPYSLPIKLLGDEDEGCAVYTISSGTLPPGLTVKSDERVISGTPTQAGNYEFFLTVTYNREESCPFKNPSDDSFRILINPGVPRLVIGPESAPPGTRASPYSLQMTATVAEPKTWSIVDGALPPGLAIDAATGLISGTPTEIGTFGFTVRAAVNADQRADTKALGIVVRDPLVIVPPEVDGEAGLPPAEVGVAFDASLTATGGTGTYTWSLAGTLPPGITFDPTSGALTGRPRIAGRYGFTVTVADEEGRSAAFTAVVPVAAKLTISTLTLRPGRIGRYYQAKLKALGGILPTLWRIKLGKPPLGIRLDRRTGLLWGTPRKVGTYRVTLEIVDALGVKSTKRFTIRVGN